MNVLNLKLNNFRNHNTLNLEFDKDFNIIYGPNGVGKTSILEAISICSMSKSFTNSSDINLIQFDKSNYHININTIYDNGFHYFVEVDYTAEKKKKIVNSYSDNCSAKELISNFPVVILNPDMKEITSGSPINRRNFIDKIISYVDISYFNLLVDYKKVLKNRNSLLSQGLKDRYFDYSILDVWTEKYLELSIKIIVKRTNFINDFKYYFQEYYSLITSNKENSNINYKINYSKELNELVNSFINNSVNSNSFNNVEFSQKVNAILKNKINEIYKFEKIRGISLWGPHKDDFELFLNENLAKDIASQGQHKSLLVSLKFAELQFIKEKRNENPVVLLDDIFSELDENRSLQLLEILKKNNSQVIITLTDLNKINSINNINHNIKLINLENNS